MTVWDGGPIASPLVYHHCARAPAPDAANLWDPIAVTGGRWFVWYRMAVTGLVSVLAWPSWAAEPVPFSLSRFRDDLRAAEATSPMDAAGDPLGGFNRTMFDANAAFASGVVAPMARTLDGWSSPPVKEAAANVYSNLIEAKFVMTNMMIGDLGASAVSAGRFAVNSTVGVAGIWDPAGRMGMKRRETTVTEAMCPLGMTPGTYLVLPLVGSTDVETVAVVIGLFGAQLWLLSVASPMLAAADLMVDIATGAAALRDVATEADGPDPYETQKDRYRHLAEHACRPPGPVVTTRTMPAPAPLPWRGRHGERPGPPRPSPAPWFRPRPAATPTRSPHKSARARRPHPTGRC